MQVCPLEFQHARDVCPLRCEPLALPRQARCRQLAVPRAAHAHERGEPAHVEHRREADGGRRGRRPTRGGLHVCVAGARRTKSRNHPRNLAGSLVGPCAKMKRVCKSISKLSLTAPHVCSLFEQYRVCMCAHSQSSPSSPSSTGGKGARGGSADACIAGEGAGARGGTAGRDTDGRPRSDGTGGSVALVAAGAREADAEPEAEPPAVGRRDIMLAALGGGGASAGGAAAALGAEGRRRRDWLGSGSGMLIAATALRSCCVSAGPAPPAVASRMVNLCL